MKCFPSTQCRRNLNTQYSVVILEFWLRKIREIIFERFRFQKVSVRTRAAKPAFSNSSAGLKRILEKLRFLDGFVWTVGLSVD